MLDFIRHCRLSITAFLLIVLSVAAQDNTRFGKPVKDALSPFANPKLEDHPIDDRKQYAVSYNGKKNTPNWVSWNLRKSDVGAVKRGDNWKQDKTLPDFFPIVDNKMYKNTGFDQGHMCPSKDRSDTIENNDATFTFTNAIPQAPNNNRKAWRLMEEYCQKLALDGNDLHIVCGPQGVRGQSKSLDFVNFLERNDVKVMVPAWTWKVVLVLPDAKTKPDARTRTIAVVMPNDQSVTTDWAKFRCSMAHVEELVEYKFFPNIEKEVADVLRERVDQEEIATAKAKKKKKKDGGD